MKRSPLAFTALILGLTLATSLSSQAPTYTTFGRGCPGSAGTPALSAAGNGLPLLGQSFGCEVRNLPFRSAGIGITGRSNRFWGTTRLPFDLKSFGMPGCLLYTEIRYTRTLFSRPGLATWSTVIPNDSALIGQSFYQQAFIIDPSIPGLGAVMSNAAKGVIGILPDLEISSGTPTISPTTRAAGGIVSLHPFTLRNRGNAPAAGSLTGFYLSSDAIISVGDQLLLSISTPVLNPGQSISSPTRHLTIPPATTPGGYWIGILADWNDRVVESNEGNNYVSTALTVTAPLPDLMVSSGTPTLTPTTVEAGRSVNISAVTVKNQGAAAAVVPFAVGYYLSPNSTITTGDRLLYSNSIGGLAAGSSFTLASRNLTIPVSMPARGYYVGILVDRTNTVPELIEGNNTVARALTVTAARPDLYISSSMPSVIPNPLVRPFLFGVPAPFELGSFTVRNSGLVASGAFRIGIYFSTNSIISTGDHRSGTVLVGSLPPGASVNIGSRLLWSSAGLPGYYWVGVFVDDQRVVTESNEGNNIKTRRVFVIN